MTQHKKCINCANCANCVSPSEKAITGHCFKSGEIVDLWWTRKCRGFALSPLIYIEVRHKNIPKPL